MANFQVGVDILLLNNELMAEPVWNEDDIRSRSRTMATMVCEVWPGPDSDR